MQQNLPWGQTGGHADPRSNRTHPCHSRSLCAATRSACICRSRQYHPSPQTDDTVVSMTVAFGAVFSLLVQGHTLDTALSAKLMELVERGELPFHAVTRDNLQPPRPGDPDPPRAGRFASPDALLSPSYMAKAAADPEIHIEPAWKVSIVYGMPCAIYHQLPAAYYLAARFHNDFESAVLHAVNGGGQNEARAILTGALTSTQTGPFGRPSTLPRRTRRSECTNQTGRGPRFKGGDPLMPHPLEEIKCDFPTREPGNRRRSQGRNDVALQVPFCPPRYLCIDH